MKTKRDVIPLYIHLSAELRNALNKRAKDEHRTLRSLCTRYLRAGLKTPLRTLDQD